MNQNKRNFIQHLIGVRGLAILMVVLFHLCASHCSNGFYGVDVFFVITGYLLFYGWKEGDRFSCVTFLKKKVVRIYPSLCVLILLGCVCIALFTYDAFGAISFGKSSLSSIFAVSNLHYIKEYSDYFAVDSNVNPLLHTWFLSVTIQIYLLWSIGGELLQRFSKGCRIFWVCVVAVLSLIYCFSYSLQQVVVEWGCAGWAQKSAVSYYDTLGRVWQVLAGGFVCVLPAAKHRRVNLFLFLLGLAILCAVAFSNMPLPIWISILVVIGTVLVLRYAGEAQFCMLLENKPLLFLGKISFSLYIAHFPIVVFYRLLEREEPDIVWSIIMLIISVFVAWILWRYVESRRWSLKKGLVLFAIALIVACVARGAYKLGLRWDMHSVQYPVYQLTDDHYSLMDSVSVGYDEQLLKANSGTFSLLGSSGETCAILSLSGLKENPGFALVGNSVAQQLYAGFYEICKTKGIPGVHLTTTVVPMWNYNVWLGDAYSWNEKKAEAFIKWLQAQSDLHTVVVSCLWKPSYLSRPTFLTWQGRKVSLTDETRLLVTKRFCEEVKKAGKHVVILTPTPVFTEFESKSLLGRGVDYVQWRKLRRKNVNCHDAEDPFVISEKEYMEYNADIFDMLYQLEREGYCKLLHVERGMFREGNFAGLHGDTLFCCDKTHITPAAAVYVMQGVADEFERLMRENKAEYLSRKAE